MMANVKNPVAFALIAGDAFFPVRRSETVLGRSEYAGIVVDALDASREHALLRLQGGALSIEDLGSQNGTLVNGTRIEVAASLRHGDVVEVGSQRFEVYIGPPRRSANVRTLKQKDFERARSTLAPEEAKACEDPISSAERVIAEAVKRGSVGPARQELLEAIERAAQSIPPSRNGDSHAHVRVAQLVDLVAQATADTPDDTAWVDRVRRSLVPPPGDGK